MSEMLDQVAEQNGLMGEPNLPKSEAQPNLEAQPEQAPVEQMEEAPAPAETFEVDGKIFASEKEAFNYLKGRNTELEAERMVEAARIEGMQEALRHSGGQVPQQVQQQVEENPEMDTEAFFSDPVGYLAKERAKIKEDVLHDVTSTQAQAQRVEQIWQEFSTRHPELADMRDIVDLVADQNAEVVSAMARKDPGKAYDYVAAKAKERLQGYVDAVRPSKVLPDTRGGVSPSGNQSVTQTPNSQKVDKPLDFISQVKQHRKV